VKKNFHFRNLLLEYVEILMVTVKIQKMSF